jgi:hypothetical protein
MEPSAPRPSRQLQSRRPSPAGMRRPRVLLNSYGSTRDYFPIYLGHYSRILASSTSAVGALGRCSRSRHRCKINFAPTWHRWDPSRVSSNRISHSSQSWEYQNLSCPQAEIYALRLCYKIISIKGRYTAVPSPKRERRCPDCGGGRADNRRPSPWRQRPGQHPPPEAAAGILIARLNGRRLRGRCSSRPTGQRGLSHRPRLAGFYQLLPRARRPTPSCPGAPTNPGRRRAKILGDSHGTRLKRSRVMAPAGSAAYIKLSDQEILSLILGTNHP